MAYRRIINPAIQLTHNISIQPPHFKVLVLMLYLRLVGGFISGNEDETEESLVCKARFDLAMFIFITDDSYDDNKKRRFNFW